MPEQEINTKGGASIGNDVDTGGGDFIGRDKTSTKNIITKILNLDGNVFVTIVAIFVIGIIAIVLVFRGSSPTTNASVELPTTPPKPTGLYSIDQLGTSYLEIGGGGDGGSESDINCPNNYVATGLVGRAGQYIDQIGLQCSQFTSDGIIRAEMKTERVGGLGGKDFKLLCPPNRLLTEVRGRFGDYLDGLKIYCTDVDGLKPSEHGPVGEGAGAKLFSAPCASGHVITGIYVYSDAVILSGIETTLIYRIDLNCTRFS